MPNPSGLNAHDTVATLTDHLRAALTLADTAAASRSYDPRMPTALITGTSTGIGEACAALLAARGWTVYAGVREPDGERLTRTHTGDIGP